MADTTADTTGCVFSRNAVEVGLKSTKGDYKLRFFNCRFYYDNECLLMNVSKMWSYHRRKNLCYGGNKFYEGRFYRSHTPLNYLR